MGGRGGEGERGGGRGWGGERMGRGGGGERMGRGWGRGDAVEEDMYPSEIS